MLNRRAIVVLVAFACAFALWMLSRGAHARDLSGKYADSPHAAWFQSQHNSIGQWCCSESDAHLYYGDYHINADGSVIVEGHTIPHEKVLSGPNPTGAAVWWFLDDAGGRHTYCFALGSGA